ncbi:phosphoglucomutase [Parageobacillus genomosp. 1]|uniref:Phosphoglucomutase n=2 Tax=Parageobacillus genomosp. 1 TaxID=1295642 RepID=A0ABC9VB04_9BACL|nr:phosphoglucomutase [Parageobacillus genomosp. 1]
MNSNILAVFRQEPLKEIAGFAVAAIEDYLISKRTMVMTGEEQAIDLSRSNVLKYRLADGSRFCLRLLGAKFYFGVKGASRQESEGWLCRVGKCRHSDG